MGLDIELNMIPIINNAIIWTLSRTAYFPATCTPYVFHSLSEIYFNFMSEFAFKLIYTQFI